MLMHSHFADTFIHSDSAEESRVRRCRKETIQTEQSLETDSSTYNVVHPFKNFSIIQY